MSTELALNLDQPSHLPAHLQGFQSTAGQNMVVGGGSYNRIGLKGNRFRLIINGQEEGIVQDNHLDVIIVGASADVSRIYYKDVYTPGDKKAPSCYSADGKEPKADVAHKESTKCQICPQNAVGSRVSQDGKKTRACGFFKRLALVLPSDLNTVYRMEAKGMTIFGEGMAGANAFSLAEYGKKLRARGIDPSIVITRLSFDTESSVPKVLFTPVGYISADQAPHVAELVNGDEVAKLLEITAQTVDVSTEEAAPETDDAPQAPPAAAQAAPVVQAPKPAVQAAPVVQAQATAAPVVQKVSIPVVQKVSAPPAVVKATPPRVVPANAQSQPVTIVVPPTAPPAEVVAQADDEGLLALLAKLES